MYAPNQLGRPPLPPLKPPPPLGAPRNPELAPLGPPRLGPPLKLPLGAPRWPPLKPPLWGPVPLAGLALVKKRSMGSISSGLM